MKKIIYSQDKAWKKLVKDSIRIRIPKAFLSTLTSFLSHASDAMAGDDRPDHGLSMIRRNREIYKQPFYLLYRNLMRAEDRLSCKQKRKAWKQLEKLRNAIDDDDRRFQERKTKVVKHSMF